MVDGAAAPGVLTAAEIVRLHQALDAAPLLLRSPGYGQPCFECPSCILEFQRDGVIHTVALYKSRPSPPTPDEQRWMKQFLAVWQAVKEAAGRGRADDACR